MSTVDIIWSASCDDVFIAKRHTTILGGAWADCESNADAAVSQVCMHFFTHEIWSEWIGDDENRWIIDVEVHEPASIRGDYEVELCRKISAEATKRK